MKDKNVILFIGIVVLFIVFGGQTSQPQTQSILLEDIQAGYDGKIVRVNDQDVDKTLTIKDGKITIDTFSFIQTQGFVDVDVVDSSSAGCDLVSLSPSIYHHYPNKDILSGSACAVGTYISFDFTQEFFNGKLIFDQLWQKKTSSDMPNFKNYYVNDLDFDYSYACWSCDFGVPDDFEKGCLTFDKKSCVTANSLSCDLIYGYEAQCLPHIILDDECSPEGSKRCSGGFPEECAITMSGNKVWATSDTCESNERCDNGACVLISTSETGWVGKPTFFPTTIEQGDTISVTQTFYANTAGNFFLEAGSERVSAFVPQAFTLIAQNECNPEDKWYANKKVSLSQGNNEISFTLTPKSEEGQHVIHTAWVTGCGGDLIKPLITADTRLIVESIQPLTEICDDEIDNDGDGLVDMDDPDCQRDTTKPKLIEYNPATAEYISNNQIKVTAFLENIGTNMDQSWIIELQPQKSSGLIQAFISQEEQICDPSFPENVHKEFKLNFGEKGEITLTTLVPDEDVNSAGNTVPNLIIRKGCSTTLPETICINDPTECPETPISGCFQKPYCAGLELKQVVARDISRGCTDNEFEFAEVCIDKKPFVDVPLRKYELPYQEAKTWKGLLEGGCVVGVAVGAGVSALSGFVLTPLGGVIVAATCTSAFEKDPYSTLYANPETAVCKRNNDCESDFCLKSSKSERSSQEKQEVYEIFEDWKRQRSTTIGKLYSWSTGLFTTDKILKYGLCMEEDKEKFNIIEWVKDTFGVESDASAIGLLVIGAVLIMFLLNIVLTPPKRPG